MFKSVFPFLRIFALAAALSLAGCHIEITTESGSDPEQALRAATSPQERAPMTSSNAETARVLTYNIQYLSTAAADHGDRIPRLRQIIDDIKPDVVAVQEVADRAAMELVFPTNEWIIFMDDDSGDRQDVALAVRRPWQITNAPSDLDADDPHFLASGQEVESYFPIRRDALFGEIATPQGKPAFTAIVIHAKARVGGRADTDHRRVGASQYLVNELNNRLKGKNVVVLGDFNDSPDDLSINILETGNADAPAGPNAWPSDFLVNLTQPLWEQGQVSIGASERRLNRQSGLINNVYPEARSRNNNGRGRNVGTGPILFDQILVSKPLAPGDAPEPAAIYLNPMALTGPGFSRPSDHLPVYADIKVP